MVDDRERGADVVLNTQTGEYSKQNKQVGDSETGKLVQKIYRYALPYKWVGSVHNHGKLGAARGGRHLSEDWDHPAQRDIVQGKLKLDGPMMLDLGDRVEFLIFDSNGTAKTWRIKCP